jgi:translation initiation factor RLI1
MPPKLKRIGIEHICPMNHNSSLKGMEAKAALECVQKVWLYSEIKAYIDITQAHLIVEVPTAITENDSDENAILIAQTEIACLDDLSLEGDIPDNVLDSE